MLLSEQTNATRFIGMMASKPARTAVFISYSHKEKKWLEQLQIHLKPLEREGLVDRWDDTRIASGENWREEIRAALDAARVAVLLVSADFLASDFISEVELPSLLLAAQQEGLVVLPVIVSPCRFIHMEGLSRFQSVNDPSRTLADLRKADRARVWVKLTEEIERALEASAQTARIDRPHEQSRGPSGIVSEPDVDVEAPPRLPDDTSSLRAAGTSETQDIIQAQPPASSSESKPLLLGRLARSPWSLLGWWVGASTVGLAVGFIVGENVAVIGIVAVFVAFAVTGFVVGGLQGLVLRRWISGAGWWILASTTGFALGAVLGSLFVGVVSPTLETALFGGVLGFTVGALQWLILRRQISGAGWWILASTMSEALGFHVSFALGEAMRLVMTESLDRAVVGGVHGAIVGMVTGGLLIWLLRRSEGHTVR